jgi:DNA-binding NarL/FixJ family response regulator
METNVSAKIKVGIADDQLLFLKSLSTLINTFSKFEVVLNAINGVQLLAELNSSVVLPDILLIDVNMPEMNGADSVTIITEKYPLIKSAALSIKDDDNSILSMIKGGCCAYLLKDMNPEELERALHEINDKGYYNADTTNLRYRRLILKSNQAPSVKMNEKEKQFLQLACSDLTYKQIASKMFLSEKTIDGYRASLFEKLNVKSRVGLALEAVRQNLFTF